MRCPPLLGVLGSLLVLSGSAFVAQTPPTLPESDVAEAKRTTLGLYVDARQAYAMWKATPLKVKIIDVRTPGEYVFVGHAPMAANLPLAFQEDRWDEARRQPVMRANQDFVKLVTNRFEKDDVLVVMCRSGTRSAKAINLLAKAGLTRVYNLVDGFEGDAVADPQSPDHGRRTLNGWRNAALPWTYELDPDLMYLQNPEKDD